VRRDARNGIISMQSARETYGVVLKGERLAVDRGGTEELRASKRDAARRDLKGD
jgi:hypothetical protein